MSDERDIVERLLERRETLYTEADSVGRVYEIHQPDGLHYLAAEEILRLRAALAAKQEQCAKVVDRWRENASCNVRDAAAEAAIAIRALPVEGE